MTEIEIPTITCKRCGHSWNPRKKNVRVCAKCRSSKFNEEKTQKTVAPKKQTDAAKPVQKAAPVQKATPAPAAKPK